MIYYEFILVMIIVMRTVYGTTNLIHLHDNLKTVIWLQSWGIFQTLSRRNLITIKQQKKNILFPRYVKPMFKTKLKLCNLCKSYIKNFLFIKQKLWFPFYFGILCYDFIKRTLRSSILNHALTGDKEKNWKNLSYSNNNQMFCM